MVTSYALVVPLRLGESARQLVASAGIGRADLKLGRRNGNLLIPIDRPIEPPLPDASVEVAEFHAARAPGSYKDIVDVPDTLRASLPSSFDIVGDLVVVKVPKQLEAYGRSIARGILEAHPNIHGVFHDEGISGTHRLRTLMHLGGETRTSTIHSEYGARFHVDVQKAYFSPRLANEHRRVADAVQPGETFVDATAGVGPFSILAALRKVQGRIVAVDLNEDALVLLRENLRLNRVEDRVEVLAGDAREVVARLGRFHRIVVNLPHGGEPILQAAWRRLAANGSAHHYTIVGRDDVELTGQRIVDALTSATGRGGSAVDAHVVHPYSPRERLVSVQLLANH